jgi:hypothetical protein
LCLQTRLFPKLFIIIFQPNEHTQTIVTKCFRFGFCLYVFLHKPNSKLDHKVLHKRIVVSKLKNSWFYQRWNWYAAGRYSWIFSSEGQIQRPTTDKSQYSISYCKFIQLKWTSRKGSGYYPKYFPFSRKWIFPAYSISIGE